MLAKRLSKLLAFFLALILAANPGVLLAAAAGGSSDGTVITLERPSAEATGNMAVCTDIEGLTDSQKALRFFNALLPYYIQSGRRDGPDWLRTTDINLLFTENHTPVFSLETIQPAAQLDAQGNFHFWQGRYAYNSGANATLNYGLGWRHLSQDKTRLVGLNAFFDHAFKYHHSRLGVGAEYFNKLTELRANAYYPISDDREVSKVLGPDTVLFTYERALPGFDWEIGSSFANSPWLSLYVSQFYFDNKYHDDLKGYKVRANAKLTPRIALELGYIDDNQGGNNLYGSIKYSLNDSLGPVLWGGAGDKSAKPEDITYKLLEKVQRDNEIKTETYTKLVETGNVRITVTNSTSVAVQGARVQAYQNGSPVGESVMTDAGGRAVFSHVATGTYTYRATFFDYHGDSSAVVVTKGQTAASTISLPVAGGTIVVNVLGATYSIVTGATVTATLISGHASAGGSWFDSLFGVKTAYAAAAPFSVTVTTDSNGQAVFHNLPPGNYQFTVNYNNQSSTISARVDDQQTASTAVVLSGAGGNIAALVNDSAGSSIAGAVVELLENAKVIASKTTNGSGAAAFGGLPVGKSYVVRAAYAAVSKLSSLITTRAGETVAVNFAFDVGGSAAITVTTSDGAAATPTFTVDGTARTADAVSGNVYTFNRLTDGSHTVTASAANYDGGSATVNISSGATTSGAIVLARQKGSAAITVTTSDGAAATPTFTVDGAARTADAVSGNVYTFNNLPTGNRSITASAAGYATGAVTVSVGKGTTAAGAIALAREKGSAAITVTTSDGGAATPTFTVDGAARTADTVSGNVYTFNNLPTGSHTVVASAGGYDTGTATVNVSVDATVAGSILLDREKGSAAITVTSDMGAAAPTFTVDGAVRTANAVVGNVYTFNNLTTGNHTIAATADGYTGGSATVNVSAGATANGSIAMIRQKGNAAITVTSDLGVAAPTFTVDGASLAPDSVSGNVYTFLGLPTGNRSITAAADGYATGSATVNVSNGATAAGSIALAREKGSAAITVTTSDLGVAAPTFTVDGASLAPDSVSGNVYTFLGLPTGNRSITAAADGYATGSATVNVSNGATVAGSIALAREKGSAAITVTTSDGAAATPTFTVDGAARAADAASGNVYTFSNLPTGDHMFAASAGGYETGTATVNVSADATAAGAIALERQKGSAAITVTTGDGGAATPTFTVDGVARAADAVSGNVYTFNNLPTGNRSIAAAADGYDSKSVTVNVGTGVTVSGSIELPRQKGSAAITVTTSDGGAATPTFTMDGTARAADAVSGNVYTFSNLPTGDHTFAASADRYDGKSVTVNVSNGVTVSGSIELPRQKGSAAITVTTSDGATATPTFTVDGVARTADAVSGNVYTFNNLPTGDRSIAASADGYDGGSVTVNVGKGTTAAGSIALTRQRGSAAITVTTNNGAAVTPTFTVDGAARTADAVSGNVYTFNNLPTGDRAIVASVANYDDGSVTVNVGKGTTVSGSVQLVRQTGNVSVWVLDQTNAATSGSVFTSGVTVTLSNGKSAVSNSYGRADITDVPTGSYKATATYSGYNSETINVSIYDDQPLEGLSYGPGSYKLNITKRTAGLITITLHRGDGVSPQAGATVTLDTGAVATSDSSGKVTFANVTNGDHNVMISPASGLYPMRFYFTVSDTQVDFEYSNMYW